MLDQADPQRATAVIRYGPENTLSLTPRNSNGRFQKVAVKPGDVVTVVLQLTAPDFRKPVDIQLVDGGIIAGPVPDIVANIIVEPPDGLGFDTGQIATVSTGGQVIFRFAAGNDVGLHRVSVIVGSNQYFFQFWRQDMSAPNNNPGMLRAY